MRRVDAHHERGVFVLADGDEAEAEFRAGDQVRRDDRDDKQTEREVIEEIGIILQRQIDRAARAEYLQIVA